MAFVPERRTSRQPLLNAPPVVLWLIVLLLALHAIRTQLPGDLPDMILMQFGFVPDRLSRPSASEACMQSPTRRDTETSNLGATAILRQGRSQLCENFVDRCQVPLYALKRRWQARS